jgi:hypothetical protein
METKPLPFTVHPSRGKILLFAAASAFLCALGITTIPNDPLLGWVGATLFGLLIPIVLVQALPKSSDFTVSEEGIEFYTVFWKQQYKWAEIERFGICTVGQHGIPVRKKIGFDLVAGYPKYSILRSFQKWRSGYERILPDDYGFQVADLTHLLAEYHSRFKFKNA